MPKNIAVILAAGCGNRFGCDTPKQFNKIFDRTVIEYTIDAFDNCHIIDEIAVVVAQGYEVFMKSLCQRNMWNKVKKILIGGKERYDSSISAINTYKNCGDANIIFHDGARPLVNENLIINTVEALKNYDAVSAAIPCTDTIFALNRNCDEIRNVPNRKLLRRAQTPQAFKIDIIKMAYDLAVKDPNLVSTDDCGIILKYMPGISIGIVMGDENNIKITYPNDIDIAKELLSKK